MCELETKKLSAKKSKIIKHLHHQKTFCVCMYKLVDIGKETYKSNGIKVIVDSIGTLWLNEK